MDTKVQEVKKVFGVGRCQICGKPLDSAADIGATCSKHVGKIRLYATEADKPPEGWLRMSKVCDLAEAVGISRHAIVNAAGGDAVTLPIAEELLQHFQVVYVGRGKWMPPSVITEGFAALRKMQEAKAVTPKEPKAAKAPAKDAVKEALAKKTHEVK